MFEQKLIAIHANTETDSASVSICKQINTLIELDNLSPYGLGDYRAAEIAQIIPVNAMLVFVLVLCTRVTAPARRKGKT